MIQRRAPLKRSQKPIARSPIKHRKRERRESWRNPGRVREDAAGMHDLRLTVLLRSYYQAGHKPGYHRCENKLESGKRCRAVITWITFELHHLGAGCDRSDTPERTMALCKGCHFDTTNELWKASMWSA